jgi:hypothetical protein
LHATTRLAIGDSPGMTWDWDALSNFAIAAIVALMALWISRHGKMRPRH